MKITPALRKEINAAVRRNVTGATPLAEVGLRGANWHPNALLWDEDEDLGDLVRLSALSEIDDDPENPGCHVLDLYVTTGTGCGRELETNVYVLIREGHVVLATHEDLKVASKAREIGFPLGKGWLK